MPAKVRVLKGWIKCRWPDKADTRCEALAQGTTHLGRGRNFIQHLTEMDGGFPAAHTVNYIPNVSHDGLGMFQSKAGLERLFYINLNGTESPTAVGDDDQSARQWSKAKHSSQQSSSGAPSLPLSSASIEALLAFQLAVMTSFVVFGLM